MAERFALSRLLIAVFAALSLIATACGARLSDEERAYAISLLSEGSQNGGEVIDPGVTDPSAPQTPTGPSAPGGGPQGPVANDGDPGEVEGPTAVACPPATSATDTGVTRDKIVVATLADISGIQPGLFQSSHQAARAATAFINNSGGICGRSIELQPLDSRTDSGGNRAAMLDACQRAFAVVGSMSAFDDGSAAPGESCGIPDITAVTTNRPKLDAANTFPAFPNSGSLGLTSAEYIARTYPDAIKKAAILWLDQAVTRANAQARQAAWESVGFEFIYRQETQVVETGFARFVREMQSRGVQYVTMISDFQNIQRLQQAMVQQGYTPQVRDWDSVAYSEGYLRQAEAVEGSLVFLNAAMFEEAASNPEIQNYTQWLQRVSPGAIPDFFGLYTWSAFRLFEKLANDIGPDLTRTKMLDVLRATEGWDGHGLHGPHRIGAKIPSSCNLYMVVREGRFQRLAPESGFDCSGGLFRL